MDKQQTCKRCSIARVNALCILYDEAHKENNSASFNNLKALVKVAQSRGFGDGYKILIPGLGKSQIRTVAWNISSLLFNDDLLNLGIPLNGRGKP
ncbi:MAG: hypothetical protein WAU47_06810 [Desulfobaccales bacterium]